MKIESKVVADIWQQFTLTNDHGMVVQLLDYGGIITNISTPNKAGQIENIVLAYENLQDYASNDQFLGAIIGPVAGRIEAAQFTLDDTLYKLEQNDGNNHLHSGKAGLHQVIWDTTVFQSDHTVGVQLNYALKDQAGGLPGNRQFQVTYTLNNANELTVNYQATTDTSTYMALTNHTYFNLSGNPQTHIQQHELRMASNQFAELDEQLIPTGKIIDVTDTPFDFTTKRKLEDGITSKYLQNQLVGNGYDHYFMFDSGKEDKVVVEEATSGRTLHIKTTQAGMVLYTANNMDDTLRLHGGISSKHCGVCFETQASPAAIHHQGFPNIQLPAHHRYEHETTFTFGVQS